MKKQANMNAVRAARARFPALAVSLQQCAAQPPSAAALGRSRRGCCRGTRSSQGSVAFSPQKKEAPITLHSCIHWMGGGAKRRCGRTLGRGDEGAREDHRDGPAGWEAGDAGVDLSNFADNIFVSDKETHCVVEVARARGSHNFRARGTSTKNSVPLSETKIC
jgi:hypothetical protein